MVKRNKRMVGGRRKLMKRQRADEGAKGDFSVSFFVPFSLFLSRDYCFITFRQLYGTLAKLITRSCQFLITNHLFLAVLLAVLRSC